jgi:hypothetical protein
MIRVPVSRNARTNGNPLYIPTSMILHYLWHRGDYPDERFFRCRSASPLSLMQIHYLIMLLKIYEIKTARQKNCHTKKLIRTVVGQQSHDEAGEHKSIKPSQLLQGLCGCI